MLKFESAKLIIPYLNHFQQPIFELLVMLNILEIPTKYTWRSTSFQKIGTLHAVTFLTESSDTYFSANTTRFSKQLSLKHLPEHILSIS